MTKSTSVRVALAVSLIAVVGVALLAWFLVLSPRLSEASTLQQQAEQLQTANLSLRNQYNQAADQAQEAPEAAAQAQVLFATMPQEAELPEVIEQIITAATDAGISPRDIQTINTTIPEPIGTGGAADPSGIRLAQLILSITAIGTTEQSLAFMDNLQGLDRALLVTSTQLAAAAEQDGTRSRDRKTVQVGGSMFVLQSQLPDLVATVEGLIAEAQGEAAAQPTDQPTDEVTDAGGSAEQAAG